MTATLIWVLAVLVVIAFVRGCRDEPVHTKYDEGEGFKYLREHPLPKGTQAGEEILPDQPIEDFLHEYHVKTLYHEGLPKCDPCNIEIKGKCEFRENDKCMLPERDK